MQYLIILVLSFLISIFLTPFFRRIGLKYGFCDRPEIDSLKVHCEPIPYLGGLAMLLGFLAGIAIFLFFSKKAFLFLNYSRILSSILRIIFLSALLLFFGFLDDLKWAARTRKNTILKFSFQILAAVIFIVIAKISGFNFQFFLNPHLNFILLFVLFVLLHNAINFQDGLDGLLGGITIISAAGFLLVSLFSGNIVNAVVSLSLLGAAAGFLIFNFPPAQIFMGNNGSYFFGLVTIFLFLNSASSFTVKGFLGPMFIVGMPILNGAFVFCRRVFKRQFIMAGDRHHLYDEIFYKFPPLKKAIFLNWFLHFILVIIGVFVIRYWE